jgi:hypothetical protein
MSSTKTRKSGPPAAEKKAAQCEQLLQALREAGSDVLTVQALAERCGAPVGEVLKLVAGKELKSAVVLAGKDEHAPVALAEHAKILAESDGLLRYATNKVRAKRVAKPAPLLANAKKFVTDAALPAWLKEPFVASIERRIAARALSDDAKKLIETPMSVGDVATRLLQAIESERSSGAASYPVNEKQMLGRAKLTDCKKPQLTAALKLPAFAGKVIACKAIEPTDGSKDLEGLPTAILTRMVALAKSESKARTELFPADKLAATLVKDAVGKRQLAESIEDACAAGKLPQQLAWLEMSGQPAIFLRSDVKPATSGAVQRATAVAHAPSLNPHTAPVAADFAAQFDDAFRRVDSRNGGQNFVKVFDLRRELTGYSPEQFDAGLRALREADLYTMDGIGSGSRLTDAERDAGIREGSSLLVYLSKK